MGETDTYVMHAEELRHGKNHARVPGEDSKRSKHHVKEKCGHEEYSELGIPLDNGIGMSADGRASRAMTTHLAERLLALGAVLGKTAFFKGAFPRTDAFELYGHVTRSTTLVILRVHFGTLVEQSENANLVPAYDSPMERCKTRIITRVWIRAVLEKYLDRERVALIRGPHERGVSSRIAFVDRDRLVQEIQEGHY
jgi:hypothetical protein